MKPKLLFLFADGWDEAAIAHTLAPRFDVVCEGFDIFRFPENAKLLWFDAPRWIDRLARRYRDQRLAGVVSTNEQYGALIAAVLARRLGVPGTDPRAIITAQHKYYARCAMSQALADANPPFALLPHRFDDALQSRELPLPFPFFVKPVKAAYSVLARRVNDGRELRRHLTFGRWEAHIIDRLVKPFADLMRAHSQLDVDPLHMLAEGLIEGVQFNVDGWMDRGRAGFFGIVDSIMYPGTQAFARFEYPSRLPADVQTRAYALAQAAMRAVGFDHGAFNVEITWQPGSDHLYVVEINPRLAACFGELYEKVHGTSPYTVLADLTLGRTPAWSGGRGRFAAATSFLLRAFDDSMKVAPRSTDRRWLQEHYPDASLHTFIKHGGSRRREMKWLGSYRYASLNLGGDSREDVERRFADIGRHVRFEAASDITIETGLEQLRPD
jgi:hypothetical protein